MHMPGTKSFKEAEANDARQLEDMFHEMEQDDNAVIKNLNLQPNEYKEAMIAMQRVRDFWPL
jgi:hypothetical protein